jgi:uncharacterized SAM-binding protein YcdF (DUF218 family)
MNKTSNTSAIKKGISCIVAVIIIFTASLVFLTGLGAVLVIADPLQKADAIVILSGGDEHRMQEAILLYQEEYAKTIILTETGSKVSGYDTDYSFEQRLALINAEIPPTAILITPKHVNSTIEEAKAVLSLVGNENLRNIIVVTDSYHTLRTRLIWREAFRNSGIKIIVRPDRGSWYKSNTWWLSKTGWETTILEYAKLANYLVFQKVD